MRERAIRAWSGKAADESVLDGTGDDDNVAGRDAGAREPDGHRVRGSE
jgi:hypothetical protein